MSNIAYVGDELSVSGFRMIGFNAVQANNDKELLLKLVADLIEEGTSIIFIIEEYAVIIQDEIEKMMERYNVTVVRVPSKAGSTGTGLQRIKELCIKALGSDLLFKNDQNE